MTCNDCRYYLNEHCHRYPPNVGAPQPTRPWLKPTEPACGEFQPKPVSAPAIERIVPAIDAATVETTAGQASVPKGKRK